MKKDQKVVLSAAALTLGLVMLSILLIAKRDTNKDALPRVVPKADRNDGFRVNVPENAHDRISAEANANEARLAEQAKRKKEKQEWLQSVGMPDETVARVDVELNAISGTLGAYYTTFRKWPEGDNREVAKALLPTGGERGFLNWPKSGLSADGELLDPWKTPYYIQITGDKIEIRSAGPNRLLWDEDDKVVK